VSIQQYSPYHPVVVRVDSQHSIEEASSLFRVRGYPSHTALASATRSCGHSPKTSM
jgi:hypothetical protein